MKKFLSLVLAVALALTVFVVPATATGEWEVDITSISDGETFAAGANIMLAADATNLADTVKNIDFYANGVKLPGTVTGNEGSIIWYAPSVGNYDITTMVTFAGDDEAVPGSESVSIAVLPKESEISVLWPKEGVTVNLDDVSLSDRYAVYGTKSMEFVPQSGTKLTFYCDAPRTDWYRGAAVIYSPELSGFNCEANFQYLKEDGTDGSSCKTGAAYTGVSTGVNHIAVSNAKATDVTVATVTLTFSNIPEENTKPVYISGIVGMTPTNEELAIPVASAEIGAAPTGVCNALGTYRINFDKPIFPDMSKAPATVSVKDGDPVEGVTYAYGFDYVELYLPTLLLDTEYTVTVPANTILAYNTHAPNVKKYVAETTFSFKTKDTSCDNATPIVKITYPDTDACLGNTGFAAQVVAPSSAINSVEFYNGATKLGDGVKMAEGEWWFKPATDLADGSYSITAKFLNASSEVVAETAAAAYTIASPKYYVKGIGNGDVIIAAEETSRVITVVDAANANKLPGNATAVSKVEFYDGDGVLLDTDDKAPYEYELVFDNYGVNTIAAKVYNIYGGNETYSNTYTVKNAIKNSVSLAENFDGASVNTDAVVLHKSGSGATLAVESSTMKFTNTAGNGVKQFAYKYSKVKDGASGSKVHYYEYDLVQSAKGVFYCMLGYGWASHVDELFNTAANKDNIDAASTKIGIILDFNTNTAIVRVGGKELKRVAITAPQDENATPILHNVIIKQAGAFVTVDNFKYAVYDVDSTQAFGTGEYVREFTGADLTSGSVTVKANAINTTDDEQTLVNVVAVYGPGNTLLLPPTVDTITYNAGDFKTQTYTVPVPSGAEKVRIFTWNGLDKLQPVGLWKVTD